MICYHKDTNHTEILRQVEKVDDTMTVGVRCIVCGEQATRRIMNLELARGSECQIISDRLRDCLEELRGRSVWLCEQLCWLRDERSKKSLRARLTQAWRLLRGEFWR
jgi:hypothetical protein